jgi:hypothetical protein
MMVKEQEEKRKSKVIDKDLLESLKVAQELER